MTDERPTDVLKAQKSLTEWLEDIGHQGTEAFRQEDNEKRERLRVLNELINLPFDKPVQFDANELNGKNDRFQKYLHAHGNELCALRLIPTEKGLPKLRMRGKSIADAYEWFLEQTIDPEKYRLDFIPHAVDSSWSTIFIVNKHGIYGEIVNGGHYQLTQGFHDQSKPIVFSYDFHSWSLQPQSDDVLRYLEKLIQYIHVADESVRDQLEKLLRATFSHNYLEGYFETSDSSLGLWFIDYSQSLGIMYSDARIVPLRHSSNTKVAGQTGCGGKASGTVQIVHSNALKSGEFREGVILVCEVTTPDYVPLMQKAAAIVTDQGGILSHAAIVARELKKPCIVGTGNATKILKDGQSVVVDADAGVVLIS